MAKIKTYLTTVTITKTVTKQVSATSEGAAILKLQDLLREPGIFQVTAEDFSAAEASEIVTIYNQNK
jgi:hypothetical protein